MVDEFREVSRSFAPNLSKFRVPRISSAVTSFLRLVLGGEVVRFLLPPCCCCCSPSKGLRSPDSALNLFIVRPEKSLAERSLCAAVTAAAAEMDDFPLRTLDGVFGCEPLPLPLLLLLFAVLIDDRNIRFGDEGGSDINHG